ncbi:MAG: valine--tRNA ligase [Dehalococcoidales bacterium]|jgi:valyl-tRNA synthetase|nr:valine--tRNA ligase [Dehalococcoidales bacterium]MDP7110117.1 valine--tRNA ligase [Dehalococcoidales bacterium]MDP7409619.1 valine--tRNA ligase [Dehalococcoidales bacterium]MDP7675953.1 valine--tRNA ligase [Dehalococcoidales bacterium]
MQVEMPKAYEPGEAEKKWYQFWLEKGYFTPKIDWQKTPFVIIMPPPNITGELHLGHALTATLEDIMVRWHRMRGEPTLWLPGADHAGIATQVVVEQLLAKEGLDRHKLGREEFQKRAWQWASNTHQRIIEQHKRLGASCDWTRERFTMDEGPSRAVRTAFVRLYDKGLIYRGERIINWCARCSTALSDLEVDHKELTGHLYYVRYPVTDGDGFITVATTRPETILGDTAVAVNPSDKRYEALVGKNIVLPVVKRVIPIVADESVSLEFGTGAVKITPGHDPMDFDLAQRQKLPLINILNSDATMNENAGPYVGLNRFVCREAILKDLEREGLLVKIEPYGHSVGHCQRCQTIIEPIASRQWFVKMSPLVEPAIKAVLDGLITIIPARLTKVYLDWMGNIRDWCISRQLWWGHRIPVWYCQSCSELTVTVKDPTVCCHCGSTTIRQDSDVLDTWFSSALWPHSTLGWPDNTEDFRYFHPTTVMETAYDIIFFWVARMIVMGIEDTGDIPFRTIYLHGLIRDEKGEKMSKTRGNVLNPLDIMEKYGTDAMRFALLTGTSPGNDSKLSRDKLEAGRNFANKLWNATRFVVGNIESTRPFGQIEWEKLAVEDRWILSRLNRTLSSVSFLMQDFQFEEAQRQINGFLWGEFCDWYIELAKIRLRSTTDKFPTPLVVLVHVLETSLRLLHPFMPFVTEELWQNLKRGLASDWQVGDSIMVAPYPEAEASAGDPEAERIMATIIEIIRAVRNARTEYKVPASQWVEVQIYGGELAPSIIPYQSVIETLARVKSLVVQKTRRSRAKNENALVSVLSEVEVVIPMASVIDMEGEKRLLQGEIVQIQTEIIRLETRLQDNAFLTRAPVAVVNKERDRLAVVVDKLARLEQELARL